MKMNEISRYSFATTLANWLFKKRHGTKVSCTPRHFVKNTNNHLFWVEEGQKNSSQNVFFYVTLH